MGYAYYKNRRSPLALAVLLIALSLMSDHHIHVVARHLMEASLSDDLPEVPDPETPDDPDDPVDENPVPAAPYNPLLPQPNLPEVPGDLPEVPPSPELPLPKFPTTSTQAVATRP
ncbi:uncharacterized protein LOC110740148 [Chenopodium quinoa]|uniref:uncharacterized protein LOC110740148 n=1 Tax=Chenopodium quinoa TaxID=63459 RepID=UPI000B77A330|nr:uncharacterized protein LOC110740148 [Chenopodium quinoa]